MKSLEAKLLDVKEAISRLDSEIEIRVQRSLNFCSKKWLRPLVIRTRTLPKLHEEEGLSHDHSAFWWFGGQGTQLTIFCIELCPL